VETRLVAAERVTALHRQVAEFRAKLEAANRELLGRSLTDDLTGLGNRRRMQDDLTRNHARAGRLHRPYGVTLFDIDYFKLFNDRYGHLAGDEARRKVAHALDGDARAGEQVYRYGGEEFLLLMPDCDLLEAAGAARRMCQMVTSTAIPHQGKPVGPAVVPVSAGVASWVPGAERPLLSALLHADRALYAAKSSGRNRVRWATEPALASEPASEPEVMPPMW